MMGRGSEWFDFVLLLSILGCLALVLYVVVGRI
jgi:hypothetical protein